MFNITYVAKFFTGQMHILPPVSSVKAMKMTTLIIYYIILLLD